MVHKTTTLTEDDVIRPFYGAAYVDQRLSKLPHTAVKLDVVESYVAHASAMEKHLWTILTNIKEVPNDLLFRAVAGMLSERVELGFLSFSTGSRVP